MSTDPHGAPQGAGWTDSLPISRRTLLRFLPRRLADGHRAVEAEVERQPPATVSGGELRAHTPQNLGRFLERLESNATLATSAADTAPEASGASRKDDRGSEEEL